MDLNCRRCSFRTQSAANYADHQSIHTLDRRFVYACPLCPFRANGKRSLEAHLCNHKRRLNVIPQPDPVVPPSAKCNVEGCDHTVATTKDLINHLKDHLKEGFNVNCPFGSCTRADKPANWVCTFSQQVAFTKHLRFYHKEANKLPLPQQAATEETATGAFGDTPSDTPPADEDLNMVSNELFTSDQVCDFIARFYLELEADLYLPSKTVQTICDNLLKIIKFTHAVMKKTLLDELSHKGLKKEEAEVVAHMTLSSDPLFRVHNVNFAQVCLLTEHRRYKYYKEHFNFVEPKKKETMVQFLPVTEASNSTYVQAQTQPLQKKKSLCVVDIKTSLELQLRDPLVQAEVKSSLVKLSSGYYLSEELYNNRIYRDFTDGEVFRRHPASKEPCLMLLLSCDGFGVTNALGSAKNKHKSVGLYYVLGNLPPEKRSKVDVLQLSTLFLDEHIKTRSTKKAAVEEKKLRWDHCLKPLIQELKNLHENGIEFQGQTLPVYAIFMLGDNLGQHQIGGFSESFTGKYSCRYCDITFEEFLQNPHQVNVLRKPEDYDLCIEKVRQIPDTSYKCVKFNSILNTLPGFHVCLPALPPCCAHDVLEGWAAQDMMLFIKYFIKEKWFTQEILNRNLGVFPFVGLDARDRPCTIRLNNNKKLKFKLSGSAVQNWNFIRFFSLVLLHGGLVKNTEDPVWQCYLLMKTISELVFAPEVSEEEILILQDLIRQYLTARKSLFPAAGLKPKHHYLAHTPSLIRLLGPLIRVFTLRMESFHKLMKDAARAGNNFINVTFTMAHKLQLRKAFLSLGDMFDDRFTYAVSCGFSPVWLEDVKEFIESLQLPDDTLCVNSVIVHGTKYQLNMWIVLECQEERLVVGNIIGIFCSNDVDFIVKKHDTTIDPDAMGLHEINLNETRGMGHVSTAEIMGSYFPYEAYTVAGKSYLTLKHRPCLRKIRVPL